MHVAYFLRTLVQIAQQKVAERSCHSVHASAHVLDAPHLVRACAVAGVVAVRARNAA